MQRDATRHNLQANSIQSMTPIIIRRRRDDVRAEAMRSSGRVYDWTDPIFQNFFRVTGDCSKLLYICETTTRHEERQQCDQPLQVSLVVKVRLFRDMSDTERRDAEFICQHLKRDATMKYSVKMNGAMEEGTMKAIGWRGAYETQVDFGTYATRRLTKTMMRRDATEYDANCDADATHLHQILATHFHDMAPALHMETVQLAHSRAVPLLGEDADGWRRDHARRRDATDTDATISPTALYAFNCTYTYSKYDATRCAATRLTQLQITL